jgi:hypothetical protein
MNGFRRDVVILAVIILTGVSFAGTYSGGFGTQTDPYQIGTVADWQELMADSNDWDANFVMIADINLQGVQLSQVGGAENTDFFKGVFDGNGHVIRNAAMTAGPLTKGDMYIGLFGRIDYNSQILNLGVEDFNMVGGSRVSGLVACSFGIITNCYTTGNVSPPIYMGGTSFGGLVGKNYGTITGSHAACDVNGYLSRVGGLVGWNVGTIIDSYSNGTVNGYESVGGLVGDNDIYFNLATYEILSIGTIARCYATGSVNGGSYVGGLVGINGEIGYGLCPVTDCYATGPVTGTGYVGGLIGSNQSGQRYYYSVTNCYAVGKVTGNTSVGGLVCPGSLPVLNCFWDIETSGKATSGGGTGLTTAQMKTLSIFKSAGWDLVDTWGIGENQTYPFLRTYSGADLNYDGVVDFIDFAVWANHWLEGI